jgi:hypothetical protein
MLFSIYLISNKYIAPASTSQENSSKKRSFLLTEKLLIIAQLINSFCHIITVDHISEQTNNISKRAA